MPEVARIGDTISHGGEIIEGSPNCNCNNRAIARIGDAVICSTHGLQTITSSSGTVFANGLGIARVGDAVSCGAVIVSGSPDTNAGD